MAVMAAKIPQEYIEIAERLAAAARPIARRYFRSDVAIESKADASPVTQADREIESALRDILRDFCKSIMRGNGREQKAKT